MPTPAVPGARSEEAEDGDSLHDASELEVLTASVRWLARALRRAMHTG
jgi:hypothetical protein